MSSEVNWLPCCCLTRNAATIARHLVLNFTWNRNQWGAWLKHCSPLAPPDPSLAISWLFHCNCSAQKSNKILLRTDGSGAWICTPCRIQSVLSMSKLYWAWAFAKFGLIYMGIVKDRYLTKRPILAFMVDAKYFQGKVYQNF